VRTTVTLDPETERLLRESMRRRGVSFKQALNDAVREGIRPRPHAKSRFAQKTFAMGSEPMFRWDKALAVSEAIEDEETVRKLSLRK